MSAARITVTITFPWWFHVYLNTLIFACMLTGMEPNWERVLYWAAKAVRMNIS